MGEMADFTLDGLSELEYGPRGETYDGFDNVMYDEETGCWEGPGIAGTTCRYCGKTGLNWAQIESGWRLYDSEGTHTCPEYYRSIHIIH